MNDAGYPRRTVVWILTNLLKLRQGICPDPVASELLILTKHARGHHPTFEILAGMAGVIELKLKACGLDGLMTKVYYVMGENDADLAKIARCSVRAVPGKIKNVLDFISGKPKAFGDGTLKTYRQYTGHGK